MAERILKVGGRIGAIVRLLRLGSRSGRSLCLDVAGAARDRSADHCHRTDAEGNRDATACERVFSRDYDADENPTGTVWRLVAAGQVPDGAETAPRAEAAATPDA